MTRYYPDPEFADFCWVVSDISEMQRKQLREGGLFWYASPGTATRFIAQKFKPNELLDSQFEAPPSWVTTCRPQWVAFMRRQTKITAEPKELKPNPALPILQRLSGLSESKIKKLIGVN